MRDYYYCAQWVDITWQIHCWGIIIRSHKDIETFRWSPLFCYCHCPFMLGNFEINSWIYNLSARHLLWLYPRYEWITPRPSTSCVRPRHRDCHVWVITLVLLCRFYQIGYASRSGWGLDPQGRTLQVDMGEVSIPRDGHWNLIYRTVVGFFFLLKNSFQISFHINIWADPKMSLDHRSRGGEFTPGLQITGLFTSGLQITGLFTSGLQITGLFTSGLQITGWWVHLGPTDHGVVSSPRVHRSRGGEFTSGPQITGWWVHLGSTDHGVVSSPLACIWDPVFMYH